MSDENNPGSFVTRAAALVAPLSRDADSVVRVDVSFAAETPRVRVTREPYRPNELRDRSLGVPVSGSGELEPELTQTFARYFDATKTDKRWCLSMTLTVYCDGQFGVGAQWHDPVLVPF